MDPTAVETDPGWRLPGSGTTRERIWTRWEKKFRTTPNVAREPGIRGRSPGMDFSPESPRYQSSPGARYDPGEPQYRATSPEPVARPPSPSNATHAAVTTRDPSLAPSAESTSVPSCRPKHPRILSPGEVLISSAILEKIKSYGPFMESLTISDSRAILTALGISVEKKRPNPSGQFEGEPSTSRLRLEDLSVTDDGGVEDEEDSEGEDDAPGGPVTSPAPGEEK